MNWKTIEQIAKSLATGPDEKPPTQKQFYLNQTEVSTLLGCGRQCATAFLSTHSVPYYCIGKAKIYFLPELLEAVEKTRWKQHTKDSQTQSHKDCLTC